MPRPFRRVVTGHDDQGRAKVLIDETVKNVASQRPGALYSVIWSSESSAFACPIADITFPRRRGDEARR